MKLWLCIPTSAALRVKARAGLLAWPARPQGQSKMKSLLLRQSFPLLWAELSVPLSLKEQEPW